MSRPGTLGTIAPGGSSRASGGERGSNELRPDGRKTSGAFSPWTGPASSHLCRPIRDRVASSLTLAPASSFGGRRPFQFSPCRAVLTHHARRETAGLPKRPPSRRPGGRHSVDDALCDLADRQPPRIEALGTHSRLLNFSRRPSSARTGLRDLKTACQRLSVVQKDVRGAVGYARQGVVQDLFG